MTGRACVLLCSALIAVATTASAQAPKTKNARSASRTVADAAISLLSKRVESVSWEDTPFEEVIGWIKDEGEGHVNVVPRWTQLSVESVDRDSLVTLELSNATVGSVLAEALDQVSDDRALGFHAYGNTLKISTKADFDQKLYVRVYNATDLLFEVPDFGQEAPGINLQQAQRSGGGGGGGGGSSQGVFSGGAGGQQSQSQGGEQAAQERKERLEELRTLLTQTIAPQTWSPIAGQRAPIGTPGTGLGRITIYNNSLIVLNTIEVHEQIAGLFSFGE